VARPKLGDEQTTIAARFNATPVGLYSNAIHPVGVSPEIEGVGKESDTASEGGVPEVALVLSPPPVAIMPPGHETVAEVWPPGATLTLEPS